MRFIRRRRQGEKWVGGAECMIEWLVKNHETLGFQRTRLGPTITLPNHPLAIYGQLRAICGCIDRLGIALLRLRLAPVLWQNGHSPAQSIPRASTLSRQFSSPIDHP